MKIALLIVLGLGGLGILMAAVGYALPVKHRAVREALYAATPQEVWRVITDFAGASSWRPDVKKVEPVVDEGEKLWREENAHGEAILYRTLEEMPEKKLVRKIANRDLPFGGQWTFELERAAAGCRLRITEDGEVYNPLYRFLSRFVFGHTATLETYLAALSARLNKKS